ncbi:uncharacterized protein F5147DRAFT_658083 [Suillus discolor]|uniref:DH domain-containing protein n=1 Tax=Suillus discolor TaxID=1912936 RepID=A0A9P7JMJ6_9AGAM|nr:uncharacterized protein F5147DRAFT_658083 [Suillus discolor]KAG2090756.1 hypothetical protein F5147DRAFT_658083 [Suillus discolor]
MQSYLPWEGAYVVPVTFTTPELYVIEPRCRDRATMSWFEHDVELEWDEGEGDCAPDVQEVFLEVDVSLFAPWENGAGVTGLGDSGFDEGKERLLRRMLAQPFTEFCSVAYADDIYVFKYVKPDSNESNPLHFKFQSLVSCPTDVPLELPTVSHLAFRFIPSNLTTTSDSTFAQPALCPGTPTDLNSRLYRTALALLDTLHRYLWGALTHYQKRVQHDVLIPNPNARQSSRNAPSLQRIFPGVRSVVDLCKPTQSKYETAVSIILGRKIDAVVVGHSRPLRLSDAFSWSLWVALQDSSESEEFGQTLERMLLGAAAAFAAGSNLHANRVFSNSYSGPATVQNAGWDAGRYAAWKVSRKCSKTVAKRKTFRTGPVAAYTDSVGADTADINKAGHTPTMESTHTRIPSTRFPKDKELPLPPSTLPLSLPMKSRPRTDNRLGLSEDRGAMTSQQRSEEDLTTASSSLPTPAPALTKRLHALLELLTSERAYASDLALLRDVYMRLASEARRSKSTNASDLLKKKIRGLKPEEYIWG